MKSRELQGQNQNEEIHDHTHQEKLSLRAFLSCMMEDHAGESWG